jgi:hypothetical protein
MALQDPSTGVPAAAPFFLMAHHRSGSNFLNDLLQAHPAVECINEPFSMHTRFFRQCDLVPWSADDYRADCLHVSMARHGALRDYLCELRDYLLCSHPGRIIGFKETALFGKLEWLHRFLPSLKLLWLVREPRAIVSSVLRSGLLAFWCYDDLVPRAFAALCPHYRRLPAAAPEPVLQAELVAMSVAVRYAMARRSLALFDHCIVPLDDAMHDPPAFLRRVAGFLGLQPHADQQAFLERRQSESRGGPFSSYRAPQEVHTRWQRDLDAAQVGVIEAVLLAAQRAEPAA